MPALPAVAKVVRVDHHFKQSEDANVQIREFFQYSGTLSPGDALTWVGVIAAAMATMVTTYASNTLNLVLTELTDLTSNTAPQVQNTTGATGTDTGAPVPLGVALVISKHINRRYRGGHARVYIPGVGASRLTDPGQWSPSGLAVVVTAYAAYITAATGAGVPAAAGTITHVNVSYFSGFTNHTYPSGRVKPIPTPRVTPLVDTILSVSGNHVPGSQRRRNEQP